MYYPYWGKVNSTITGEEGQNPVTPSPSSDILVREPAILERVNNRIYFYAEVSRGNILKLNRELRDMSNQHIADAQIRNVSLTPIYLHINSYGGGVYSGLAGMDEVIKTAVPVITVVDGCCASAATFLSVVGNKRFINRHAVMLIHQLSSFMWGKYEEFKDEMQNLDMLMDMIRGVYKEYTKIPMSKLDEILKHDLLFDAKTCLEYGLVDEIL